jgi:hypothetical protein
MAGVFRGDVCLRRGNIAALETLALTFEEGSSEARLSLVQAGTEIDVAVGLDNVWRVTEVAVAGTDPAETLTMAWRGFWSSGDTFDLTYYTIETGAAYIIAMTFEDDGVRLVLRDGSIGAVLGSARYACGLEVGGRIDPLPHNDGYVRGHTWMPPILSCMT